jgi:transcriptional regulator with XRE-family HTH domain
LAKRAPQQDRQQNDRLRRAREERNLTQAELAHAVGTSSFTVSRWELGVQTPQPHFRERLCALFALSPQELGLIPELPPVGAGPAVGTADGEGSEWEGAADAETRARRDLLGQVWRHWIGTELEAAVGGLPRLALALSERPGAVDDPLRVLPLTGEPDRPLRGGTTIDAAYHRAGEQLLVLGDPGAGKTTLLLELARRLLEEGPLPPRCPMPVVFHLASWAEARQPLARWLVDELHRRYGVARRLGADWVADEQVLPLLDGLDEVAEEHRAACVAAINAFHAEHGQLPMAVCCRTAQYASLGARLRLRGAVLIQPLTPDQVDRYLAEAGETVAEIRALIQDDERLRELLATPLFLGIIVRTYGGRRRSIPPLGGPLAERRRHVLGDYVQEMLARPRAGGLPDAYPPRQTIHWLSWLAGAMRDHGEGVFHVDWIQPSWLPARPQRALVTFGPAALVVLVGGLVGTLDMLLASLLLHTHPQLLDVAAGLGAGRIGLPREVAGGAAAGAAVGLLAGLLAAVFTYDRRIAPTNPLRWSWATFRRNLPNVLAAVVGAVLVSLLVDRVLTGLLVHLVYGLLLVVLFKALTLEGGPLQGLLRRLPRHPWQWALLLAGLLAAGAAAAVASGAPPATLAYRVGARLVVGLCLGLMFGPQAPLCEPGPPPGEGIEMSRRHGVNAGLASGLVAVVLFGLTSGIGVGRVMGLPVGVFIGLADGLSIAVIVGIGVALRRGGGAYLRHAVLRRLLVRAGAAPRDYVGFLDHACALILMRRRGGGYEFVHRLLLDHFADLRTRGAAAHRDP